MPESNLPPAGQQVDIILLLLLLIGLAQGLIFLFLIPPWQHYDEPTQFEYAWLVANGNEDIQNTSPHLNFRREIAASMAETGFYSDIPYNPVFLPENTRIWIGISQQTDPPFYYYLVSVPLRLLQFNDVSFQLYAGRAVSVLLYLGTIATIYLTTKSLTAESSDLRWLVPLAVILTPAFSELMTAINNDVGAVLIFSVFLLLGVRMIREGFTPGRLIGLSLLTILAIFTKSTIFPALFLFPLAIGLTFYPSISSRRWIFWAILILFPIMAVAASLQYKDPSYWYRTPALSRMNAKIRSTNDGAIALEYDPAISTITSSNPAQEVFQPLSPSAVNTLKGRKFTLGAWLWADAPTPVRLPYLWTDQGTTVQTVTVSTHPEFYAITGILPAEATRTQVVFSPLLPDSSFQGMVYLRNPILVKGNRPLDTAPAVTEMGMTGTWGERSFENLIRNPGLENTWVTIHPAIERLIADLTPISLYQLLTAMQDHQVFGWVYRASAVNLIESYWARFGWNHITIPPPWYKALALLSLLGLLGFIFGVLRSWRQRTESWKLALVWFLISASVIWLQALMRPGFPIFNQRLFIPSARYAFPAILPTSMVIVSGWYAFFEILGRRKAGVIIIISFLILVNIVSLYSIYNFRQGL